MDADADLYAGGWLDQKTGRFHLDLARNIQDEAEAIQLGKDNDQKAIFNLNDFTEIRLKGSGLHTSDQHEQEGFARGSGEDGGRDNRGAQQGSAQLAILEHVGPGAHPSGSSQKVHGGGGGGVGGKLSHTRYSRPTLDAMLGISIPKGDSNSCFASARFNQVERF
jgi:hypothetical protein